MAAVAQLDGVGQLQVAKEAATAMIEDARKQRIARLKQAHVEAALESENYKAEREAALRVLEQKMSKYESESSRNVATLTEEAIQKLRRRFEDNKEATLDNLLTQVLTVKVEIHQNSRKNQ